MSPRAMKGTGTTEEHEQVSSHGGAQGRAGQHDGAGQGSHGGLGESA